MSKKITYLVALLVVLTATPLFAAGFGNSGVNNNALPIYQICSGAPEVITGTVINYGMPGNGLELKVGDSLITLYGMGPYWYWERQNVDMPEIGETVTAVVSNITTTDYKVILQLNTVNEGIQLRDPNTCQPLWRGGRAVK